VYTHTPTLKYYSELYWTESGFIRQSTAFEKKGHICDCTQMRKTETNDCRASSQNVLEPAIALEEPRLRVTENTVLRRKFETRSEKVTRG